jgi:hypothetical protein
MRSWGNGNINLKTDWKERKDSSDAVVVAVVAVAISVKQIKTDGFRHISRAFMYYRNLVP